MPHTAWRRPSCRWAGWPAVNQPRSSELSAGSASVRVSPGRALPSGSRRRRSAALLGTQTRFANWRRITRRWSSPHSSAATPGRSSTQSTRSRIHRPWPTLPGTPRTSLTARSASSSRLLMSRPRLRSLIEWTRDHIAETEVNDKIADDVREGMEKSQREFLLRQQLNAIRKELGRDEPDGAQDYRTRVEEAQLPDDVRKAAMREVGKLERASDQNPESGYIRTWLDTILDLPWGTKTTDSIDIEAARKVLDADHHGLEDVKDRIVEYLAIRARRASRGLEIIGGRGSGAVMALVGPPGVGKTSLGESVARALGRKFVRVALGGVRDEAEIRGHRRTYVGALPGRIVRAITEAGSMNPVVLLDEIDKVGSDYRGDPASALLEVLDPAQNHTFRDHYLEVDLDLSDVLFLATANVVETIPQALLDRMELVNLDG